MKITEQVWQFSEPIVQEKGCSLWDVEYVREGGEWFSELEPDNTPHEYKEQVGPWKCPYHNGRMCLEIMSRLG